MKKYIIILSLLSFSLSMQAQRRGRQTPPAQTTPTAQTVQNEEVKTKGDRKKVSRRGRVNKWIYEADKAFKAERYFKAFGYYDRAYNRAPEGIVRRQLRVKIGETQRRLNHPVEAVMLFDREWTDGNREAEFLKSYADVLLKTARYDMAENVYELLLKQDTTNTFYQNRILSCQLGQTYSDTINIIDDQQILPQPRISTAFSEYGMIIADGKLIYSSSQRVNPETTDYRTGESFSHIYTASMALDSMLWDKPSPLSFNIWGANINDGVFTYDPENKIGYFQRCNQGNCGIYTTTYENGEWTIPQKFEMNGIAADSVVGHPAISPDGKRLIFASRSLDGQGGSDLWMTTKIEKPAAAPTNRRTGRTSQRNTSRVAQSSRTSRTASKQTEKNNAAPRSPNTSTRRRGTQAPAATIKNNDWDVPVNLGKIVNTKGDEVFPVWVNNNAIAFSSNGNVGYGGLDLYVAIADEKYNFVELNHVGPPINSSFDDYTLVISPEIERIFFSSSRYKGFGHSDEVFSFPKTATILDLQFEVTDIKTEEPLANVSVSVCGIDSCEVITTDSLGRAKYARSKSSKTYNMGFAKEGYYSQEHQIDNLNDALDIIPTRDVRKIAIAMQPDTSLKVDFAPTPAEWTFFAENKSGDTANLVAMADLDTLAKLLGPETPCGGKLMITLDTSMFYTQIGPVVAIDTPQRYFDPVDSCEKQIYTQAAFFTVPFTADSVSDFLLTGKLNYVVDRPDSLFVYDTVPFAVPVKGTQPLIAQQPTDSTPIVSWFYDVETDSLQTNLVVKALIKQNYELISEKNQAEPFVPMVFRFNPAPENYNLIGTPTTQQPTQRKTIEAMIDSVAAQIPVSYYIDSVIFRQPITINNPMGFEITGDFDYSVGQKSEYAFNPNVPLRFPIPGQAPLPAVADSGKPAVVWYASVEQSEDGTTAQLIAKAEINADVILISDKHSSPDGALKPITFSFMPDAENYSSDGRPRPQSRESTIAGIEHAPFGLNNMVDIVGAISFYKDSAVFRLPVDVLSNNDFAIHAEVNFMTGSPRGFEPYFNVPLVFPIIGKQPEPEPEPEETIDEDISWGDEFLEEETDTAPPVFNNKLTVKESEVQDLSDCMRPGMTPEEITDCLNRNKKEEEVVDVRTTETYRERINDPNRRANLAVLPKDIPCKDCEKKPQQQKVSEELYVQAGDDKKILKLTDQAGNTTYLDLAPNTKYHINVANAVTELAANLPKNVTLSDLVKTATTKDYVIYECIPKLAEIGDETYVNNIYYDFDKSDIIRDGHRELDRLIIIAIKNPHLKFEVTSHADERGSDEYNNALTESRLQTVTEYIKRKGLDMGRLITKAAGKSDPLIKNAVNDDEHALNRRTTIRLYDPNATNQLKNQAYDVEENNPLQRKGLWFRVQLGAFKAAPEYPLHLFKDYIDVLPDAQLNYYQDRDGLYKFTVGDFNSIDQARKLNQRILDADKEAYIVAFMDGQRITVSEAQAIINRQPRR